VWLARNGLVDIALRTAADEHPPLHYWLLHFWNALAGESKYAVRFSSVFASVLTVALVYTFSKRFFGYGVGVIAAALLAFSRFHIWWSQETKMYALLVLLAVLSLYLFLRAMDSNRLRYWVLYLLVTLAALYTHYLAVLLLAVQWAVIGLALLYTSSDRKRLTLTWLFVQVVLVMGFAPWVYLYLKNALVFEKAEAFDLLLAVKLYIIALPLGISTDLDRYIPLALLFLVLAVGGGVTMVVRGPKAARLGALALVIAVLVVPVALVLFSLPKESIYHPKVSERYVIVFLPMYMVILAYGVCSLLRRHSLMGVAALLGIAVVSGYMLTGYYASRRPTGYVEPLVRFIQSNADRDDAVVLNTDVSWPIYHYYLGRSIDHWVHVSTLQSMNTELAKLRFSKALQPLPQRLWLVSSPGFAAVDPEGVVFRLVEQDFVPVVTKAFERIKVTLYQRPGVNAGLSLRYLPSRLKGHATSIGDVTFLGFEPVPTSWQRGESMYLFTYWQLPPDLKDDYTVSAVIVDDRNGEAIKESALSLAKEYADQLDGGPIRIQALHKLTIGPTLPKGEHKLQLEVRSSVLDERPVIPLQKVNLDTPTRSDTSIGELDTVKAEIRKLARLRGYYLDPPSLKAGQEAKLYLVWEVIGTTDISYTVFSHVYNDEEKVWVNGDTVPGQGEYPTTGWMKGNIIDDTHTLRVPNDIPSGRYRIAVGMYDAATGVRLEAVDGEARRLDADRVPLMDVEVVGD